MRRPEPHDQEIKQRLRQHAEACRARRCMGLEFDALRRPAHGGTVHRQRAAGIGAVFDQRDDLFGERAKSGGIGIRCRQHQRGKDKPVRGGELLEPARQAGEIGPGARRRRRHGEFAALDGGVGPGQPAPGEHRIREVFRRPVARHAHVALSRADRRNRDQRDPQLEAEFAAGPGGGRRQRLPRRFGIARRHRKARAVAAEHEGKFAAAERVGHRRDHRGSRHVDGLVALRGDRLG